MSFFVTFFCVHASSTTDCMLGGWLHVAMGDEHAIWANSGSNHLCLCYFCIAVAAMLRLKGMMSTCTYVECEVDWDCRMLACCFELFSLKDLQTPDAADKNLLHITVIVIFMLIAGVYKLDFCVQLCTPTQYNAFVARILKAPTSTLTKWNRRSHHFSGLILPYIQSMPQAEVWKRLRVRACPEVGLKRSGCTVGHLSYH